MFEYLKSYKKLSHQHKMCLDASREGKAISDCSMAPIGGKKILIAVPYTMVINEAGRRIEKLGRLYKNYTLIPITMRQVA